MENVSRLGAPRDTGGLSLGALWNLSEQSHFIRDNVDGSALEADFAAVPDARACWAAFELREAQVAKALREEGAQVTSTIRRGELGPVQFRAHWEGLGFSPNVLGAGTPADDYLDGLFHLSRLTLGEELPPQGMPNMASRAERISDFLSISTPAADDVVVDIGSGSGKVALTVAASSTARVFGLELGSAYVAQANRSATALGLGKTAFEVADARDYDYGRGSIFYLYYPFHGAVARTVAESLGRLAREKDITIYSAGPSYDFGEHFLRQVDSGALALSERRGPHAEVMVLRSQRA